MRGYFNYTLKEQNGDGLYFIGTVLVNIKYFTANVSNLDDIQLRVYSPFETVTEKCTVTESTDYIYYYLCVLDQRT